MKGQGDKGSLYPPTYVCVHACMRACVHVYVCLYVWYVNIIFSMETATFQNSIIV